jgi:hypothetical protein
VGGVVGYEPGRVRVLADRALGVVAHLAAARCPDPAAADAVRSSAVVLGHIEGRWLPALHRVLSSDALLAWRTIAPTTMPPGDWFDDLRTLHGQALGTALAARAGELSTDEFDELQRAVAAASGDTVAMTALISTLGADGLIALVSRLVRAAPTTAADALAPTLRDAFAAAAPTLPVGFGAELVQAAAKQRQEDRDPVIGVALGYLFNGPQLPTAFLAPAVRALHDVEVSAAADRGQDAADGDGAILWVPTLPPIINSPLLDSLRPDPDAPYLAGRTAAVDPVYAMLRQLGRDGAAGRAVFTDRTVAAYFFAQRPITEDHGQAVTAAAAAAAATDGVVPSAQPAAVRAAMFVASAFMHDFATAHAKELLGHVDDEVSENVAAVLGRHLPSVHLSVTPSSGNHRLPEAVGVVTSMHEVLGPSGPRVRAQFDPAALDTMLDLAANAPAGVRTLRAYLTTFQATLATTGASRIASGTIPASAANDFLAEAMQDAGRLEGVFATHVGHRAEEHGRDRDEELTRWVSGLGATVQFGLGVATGPVTSAVVGPAVGPVADELGRRVATNEAKAEVDAERLAQDAADRLLYLWDRQLVEHNVLAPELPDRLRVNGRLPSFDELPARLDDIHAHDPDPDHATYDLRSFFNAVDVARGGAGIGVDDGALYDAVKAGQLAIYDDLD